MSNIRPSLLCSELERDWALKTSGNQEPERASVVFVFVLYIPHLLDTETPSVGIEKMRYTQWEFDRKFKSIYFITLSYNERVKNIFKLS
jgi:hypothetical protein